MIRRKNHLTRSEAVFIIFHIEEKTDYLIEIGRTKNLEDAKKIADKNHKAYVYSKDNRVVYSTE